MSGNVALASAAAIQAHVLKCVNADRRASNRNLLRPNGIEAVGMPPLHLSVRFSHIQDPLSWDRTPSQSVKGANRRSGRSPETTRPVCFRGDRHHRMRRYRDGRSRKGRLSHARTSEGDHGVSVAERAADERRGGLPRRPGDWAALVHGGAAVILPLVLGCLGYRWGGKLTMLVGAGVGAWLTWAFYGPLVMLWRAALVLGIFLGMMAAFVYVLQIFWSTL
jgi:hypothetical protein